MGCLSITGTCPWSINTSTSIMVSPIPSQEPLLDQDLDFLDQLPNLPDQWLLFIIHLLAHQAIDLPHTHINSLLPHRLTNPLDLILIPSQNLITFLNLSQSLVTSIILNTLCRLQ